MRSACCLSWGTRSCDRTRIGSNDNVPPDPVFTITCLEHAYPRMLPGSVMVFDDYRVSEGVYPGADRAVDEFFRDKPEKLERLHDPRGLRTFTRIVR